MKYEIWRDTWTWRDLVRRSYYALPSTSSYRLQMLATMEKPELVNVLEVNDLNTDRELRQAVVDARHADNDKLFRPQGAR